jgi:HK97 family phage major capsid protein
MPSPASREHAVRRPVVPLNLLVDMVAVVVVRDIDAQVQILTELYASTGEVGIRVSTRYDLAVTHPEAVTVLNATP